MSRYNDRHYRPAMRRTGRRMRGGYPVMIAQFPCEPTAAFALATTARFVYRHRSAFAPFWVTGTLFATAAVVHAHHPMWWVVAAVLTFTVGVVLAVPHRLIWTHPGRPAGPGLITRIWEACGIDRTPERIYATVIIIAAGSWLSAAIAAGPTAQPLPRIATTATLILGIPWWAELGLLPPPGTRRRRMRRAGQPRPLAGRAVTAGDRRSSRRSSTPRARLRASAVPVRWTWTMDDHPPSPREGR